MADPLPDGAVALVGHRVPALAAGDYTVTVTQATDLDHETYATTRTFTVAGDRFTLAPGVVRSMFPPDGGLGEYDSVLPHVVLDSPTLPWQRSPDAEGHRDGAPAPWLALLVFTEDERPRPHTVTVATLTEGAVYTPAPEREHHQGADDPVTVIDVDPALLADLLPRRDELPFLAHVRTDGSVEGAVVVATRLPPPGQTVTVHLVSLEGRYTRTGVDLGTGTAPVRLVTLASWRFAGTDAAHSFTGLAHDLARDGGAFRLPPSGEPVAEAFLAQGFAPARARLRDGARTACWYRGPFVAAPADNGPVPVARGADELLRFHPRVGMLDVGDAAAWQLGRLLALQSTDVAVRIRGWRRRRRHAALRVVGDDYPLAVAPVDDALPAAALAWLRELALLRGVPLRYLVPDERLLPVESIRFVGVDQRWVRHLVDGACSIGRLSDADAAADAAAPPPVAFSPLSGALIRSELVSGYPDLVVEAFDAAGAPLAPVRSELLAPATLLCLFDGVVRRLDLRQHPVAQHFGVEQDEPGTVTKTLRSTGDRPAAPGPMRAVALGPRSVVPLAAFTAAMAEGLGVARLDPADLAAQMIEVAQRVTFTS